jgi:hypothetical protein
MNVYINGVMFASSNIVKGQDKDLSMERQWLPNSMGEFIITAHAMDSKGNSGISEPVLITVIEGSSSAVSIKAEEGDTLEVISDKIGAMLKDMQQANPGMEADAPIDPEEWIYVPIKEEMEGTTLQAGAPRKQGSRLVMMRFPGGK